MRPAASRSRSARGPAFESTYERMVSCIEPERALIHWTDFYRQGRAGEAAAHGSRAACAPVGDRFIPFAITMETLRTGSRTLVRTESYELVSELSERLFSTWNLEAGDAERDRKRTEGLKVEAD